MSPFINSKEHGIKGSASPKDLETFLQLTYLYYTDPRFEESEFQPGLDQIKTVIGNIVKQPNYMFQKEIIETLYNSPRMTIIGQDVLDKFNYATMEKVVRNIFSDASGATVEIVGDFDQEQLKGMVEKYIGSLPTAKKPTSIMTNVDYVKNMATNKFAADMTTEKTSVGLLYSGISKFGMKELVQADALKYILDVVYTESIREEEGGTYGVSVSYIAEKFPVENILLQIVFDTDPAKADNLIEIAKKGLFDISKQGPTEAQLQDVKKNLLKNLPENRIKNSYWLNNLTYQYKYGIDRDSDYENIVNSITVKDIRNFTKKILRQGNLVEVVMTPKQK